MIAKIIIGAILGFLIGFGLSETQIDNGWFTRTLGGDFDYQHAPFILLVIGATIGLCLAVIDR